MRCPQAEVTCPFCRQRVQLGKVTCPFFQRRVQLGKVTCPLFRRRVQLGKVTCLFFRQHVQLGKVTRHLFHQRVQLGKVTCPFFRQRVQLAKVTCHFSRRDVRALRGTEHLLALRGCWREFASGCYFIPPVNQSVRPAAGRHAVIVISPVACLNFSNPSPRSPYHRHLDHACTAEYRRGAIPLLPRGGGVGGGLKTPRCPAFSHRGSRRGCSPRR